ncbi:MAG TPA: hypothetical protein HA257_02180 [Candidatus Methanoperedenaceae archaeon]|nr:hypothetical protein [Candidatus Methanoperedenaceae archaeon]
MRNMNKLMLALAVVSLLAVPASAVDITGIATSGGKPVPNVDVVLNRLSDDKIQFVSGTKTQDNGEFAFSSLSSGMYLLNVTYSGATYSIPATSSKRIEFRFDGSVRGTVIHNVSKQNQSGVSVALKNEEYTAATTLTDASGKFAFDKVALGNYTVEATYMGVPYKETISVNGNATVDFAVYNSTRDMSVITVPVAHIIMNQGSGGIQVMELVVFQNTGDKVFYDPDRAYFGTSVPKDITNIRTSIMDCCLKVESGRISGDPMDPLMPNGTFEFQLEYLFTPKSADEIMFNKEMLFDTASVSVLASRSSGLGIESKTAFRDTYDMGGQKYDLLMYENLKKGEALDAKIAGYKPQSSETQWLEYLVPVIGLAIIGAVAYPFIKRRLPAKRSSRRAVRAAAVRHDTHAVAEDRGEDIVDIEETEHAGEHAGDTTTADTATLSGLIARKKMVFGQLYDLDKSREKGEVSESDYKEQRKEYRREILELVKESRAMVANLDLTLPLNEIESVIKEADSIDALEELLDRERSGDDREEVTLMIEDRIEKIESEA